MPSLRAPLALRRIPQEIAHAGSALGRGRVWHATGDTWRRFELHWQGTAPACRWQLCAGAGLIGLNDLTLLQLGSGIRPGLDWTEDAFDDAAHLACAFLDDALLQALGGPLQWQTRAQAVRAHEPGAAQAARLGLRLVLLPRQGAEQFALTLCMAGPALVALLRDARWEPLPPAPAAPWLDNLPCDARLCIASVRMALAQLQSLGRGDLVVLCAVSQGMRAAASLQLGRIVAELQAPSDALHGLCVYQSWRWAETWPQAQGSTMTDRAQDESFPVDDVEVTLEVLCGRTRLSVGALRALREGSLLPLDCPASAQVELVVASVRVGTGELVQVDGWLAVEVRQLAAP